MEDQGTCTYKEMFVWVKAEKTYLSSKKEGKKSITLVEVGAGVISLLYIPLRFSYRMLRRYPTEKGS